MSRSRSSTLSLKTHPSREFLASNPQSLFGTTTTTTPTTPSHSQSTAIPIPIPIPSSASSSASAHHNPAANTTDADADEPSFLPSQSWKSAHSLATIRPGAEYDHPDDFDAQDDNEQTPINQVQVQDHRDANPQRTAAPSPIQAPRRKGPQFIIDMNPPSTSTLGNPSSSPTNSSSTFLTAQTSPSTSADQRRPSLRDRSISVSSVNSTTSIPSSLHLGGTYIPSFLPPKVREWLLDHPIVFAGIKGGLLFALSIFALWLLLHTLLPELDEADKAHVKLPKSFDELKALNEVLQVYKEKNYWRVLGCYMTVYLFLQAFSIPGSMYLSILGGAMYGVAMALPLACFCVATGALLCYFISLQLGPALLLNSEKWQRRLEAWTDRIDHHREDLISYLIVLRIAPLPPHWVVNVVAPHLGISVWTFWISTFFGIMGVSYIHTEIGTTLDKMTGTSDFHLISIQNGLGLGGIMVAVLVPVFLRRRYKKDIEQAASDDPVLPTTSSTPTPPEFTLTPPQDHKAQAQLRYIDDEEEMEDAQSFIDHASVRSFAIGDDEEDDDEGDDPLAKGKGKATAGEMNGDRGYPAAPNTWQTGSKASRILGVDVDGDRLKDLTRKS
ncbi:hypothetical protein T439DRAFT_326473 [Meredithblackwellia eburnea MCA 4105]